MNIFIRAYVERIKKGDMTIEQVPEVLGLRCRRRWMLKILTVTKAHPLSVPAYFLASEFGGLLALCLRWQGGWDWFKYGPNKGFWKMALR